LQLSCNVTTRRGINHTGASATPNVANNLNRKGHTGRKESFVPLLLCRGLAFYALCVVEAALHLELLQARTGDYNKLAHEGLDLKVWPAGHASVGTATDNQAYLTRRSAGFRPGFRQVMFVGA
jgi:hypothetical protein